MTDKLEKMIQQAAKLELLLMLQEEGVRYNTTAKSSEVLRFINKFVEENKQCQ